jgi:UDP-N-acetylmuramoylalanine--D-glutamate ligase
MDFRGRKTTVMGLGRHGGGVAAARFCAQAGALVTVTDLAEETALSESMAILRDMPIAKFTLGRHLEEDFSNADIVVVNPAVKPANSWVELARQTGAQITSETELFLSACPAKVIGVTGTVGKSTTAAMLAAILQTAGRITWLGGNIGHSLLSDLPRMQGQHVVVLEISSFQLHWLSDNCSWPHGAIVTNCSPNHLDWHPTWGQYITAKQRLIQHLPTDGLAVFNTADRELSSWRSECRGICDSPWPLKRVSQLKVSGEHNQINAACAARMAEQLGVDDATIEKALAEFNGLPHRLRLVAEIRGRQFYNDSKSTTPAATIAALNAMQRSTWLLLGGVTKQIDLAELVNFATARARGIAVFGSVAEELHDLITRNGKSVFSNRSPNLTDALRWCWQQSQPGEAILLSPGCASTDQFLDFAHRGEEFERLVQLLD